MRVVWQQCLVCVFPLGPAAVCSAVPLLGIWLLLGYLGSSSKQMPRADQTAWNLGVFLLYLCGLWCDQEYFSGWFQVSVAYLGQERSINSTVYTGKLFTNPCCLSNIYFLNVFIPWMLCCSFFSPKEVSEGSWAFWYSEDTDGVSEDQVSCWSVLQVCRITHSHTQICMGIAWAFGIIALE